MTSPHAWPDLRGIAYGGDYNPEQWSRETWREDVTLMREAGVNLVSVGIFSWALVETAEGEFDFSWLDELLDLLHENGVAVDLGTPTASPPAWFFAKYPEAHVIDRDGRTMGFGSRGMASPSSPAYREAIVRYADALASRYATHPAVVMWHVHNEYGVPVGEDYSPQSVTAFREWLREKYTDLDGLNRAWGTAFWGQHYTAWDHIGAPAVAPSVVNPAQRLDFARFTDHQLRQCFIAERDAIRVHSDKPITTNFMANQSWTTDLWAWGREVDIVSDDHYLWAADEDAHLGLAIAADLSRSVGGGKPWILMEHSTSAVNWQPRNIAKRPGEMARNSLTHFGRGADAILFFQWRAGRSGAEKFHSAMLPHAGVNSRVFREVVSLGADLGRLEEVQGASVKSDVAILWDFESFWAQDLEWRPTDDLSHQERIRAFYERLWRDGIPCDFALPGQDLSDYRLVVAPAQYMLSAADAENLTRYVADGGTLLVSYFSAVVDENDAVHPGGFLAPLRDVLGVDVEEHLPLRAAQTAAVTTAAGTLNADHWQEALRLHGAEAIGTYQEGPAAGEAAITRHAHGKGTGWYISTRLDADGLNAVMQQVYADAGIQVSELPEDLEVMVRNGQDADFRIVVNHADQDAVLPVSGRNLLGGTADQDSFTIPAGGVAVIRSTPATNR